jgi:hypothetical protein
MVLEADGNLVIAGHLGDSAAVLRVSCHGNVIWHKTYTAGSANGFVAVSNTGYAFVTSKGVVTRINSEGDTQWSTQTNASKLEGLVQTTLGFAAVGKADNAPVLVLLDKNGQVTAETKYEIENVYTFSAVANAPDGGLIVGGSEVYGEYAWVGRLNAAGTNVWGTWLTDIPDCAGAGPCWSGAPRAITMTANGDIGVLTGWGMVGDWVVRLDSSGKKIGTQYLGSCPGCGAASGGLVADGDDLVVAGKGGMTQKLCCKVNQISCGGFINACEDDLGYLLRFDAAGEFISGTRLTYSAGSLGLLDSGRVGLVGESAPVFSGGKIWSALSNEAGVFP